MSMDVAELKAFYADTLGAMARRLIGEKLRELWPNVAGDRLLGIGFATPYLAALGDGAESRLAFMPAEQGVIPWPTEGRNATALVLDDALPLPGASVDRVLAIHLLEMSDNGRGVLQEVWRVMAPGGRLVVVVPNRAGVWARSERTPFGHGRPFSRGQLAALLRETLFSPVAWTGALAMPPWSSAVLLGGAPTWEQAGAWLWPRLSGVLIVEATKLVQQRVAAKAPRRIARRAFNPALAPPGGIGARSEAG